jgi:trans-aconitate methyltransferase
VAHEPGLFTGAAPYYTKYRPPYPDRLITDLINHLAGPDQRGRLLDLGCGPGTLTLPLAPAFAETVALDPEEEMIAEAKRLPGADRVRWIVARAEDISPDLGRFRVVACGSSFHWMDRDLVLSKITALLEPGGGIALVGGVTAWWDGPQDWHKAITSVIRRYLGVARRAGPFGYAARASEERFEQTLQRNRWRVTFERDYPVHLQWDLDSIVGHLWATSFAGRIHFGDRVEAFEHDLRTELQTLHPDGAYTETVGFGLVCGQPPTP